MGGARKVDQTRDEGAQEAAGITERWMVSWCTYGCTHPGLGRDGHFAGCGRCCCPGSAKGTYATQIMERTQRQ
jgi:hypothetical protein